MDCKVWTVQLTLEVSVAVHRFLGSVGIIVHPQIYEFCRGIGILLLFFVFGSVQSFQICPGFKGLELHSDLPPLSLSLSLSLFLYPPPPPVVTFACSRSPLNSPSYTLSQPKPSFSVLILPFSHPSLLLLSSPLPLLSSPPLPGAMWHT